MESERTFVGRVNYTPEAAERADFRALLQCEIEGLLSDLRFEMEAWADIEAMGLNAPA